MSDPAETARQINARQSGFNRAMGLSLLEAGPERVVGELTVGEQHRQPYGIVHGGVHAGMIETLCSVGAALHAMPRGQAVVGLENHTSLIRAVREGRLRIEATPITRGRRSQVWEATVRDAEQRVVATGRVRLLCLEPDAELAGEKPELSGR